MLPPTKKVVHDADIVMSPKNECVLLVSNQEVKKKSGSVSFNVEENEKEVKDERDKEEKEDEKSAEGKKSKVRPYAQQYPADRGRSDESRLKVPVKMPKPPKLEEFLFKPEKVPDRVSGRRSSTHFTCFALHYVCWFKRRNMKLAHGKTGRRKMLLEQFSFASRLVEALPKHHLCNFILCNATVNKKSFYEFTHRIKVGTIVSIASTLQGNFSDTKYLNY